MVKLGSHRNDEISGTGEVQLQFSALLGSLASVIGPVEFVPLDLVGRHVYEVQSFSCGKMIIMEPLCYRPCHTTMPDDYVGDEVLWQCWLSGESEQF